MHAKMLSETPLNGMGYYAHNLMKGLAAVDKANIYDLYSSGPIIHKVEGVNFRERVTGAPLFWTNLKLPRVLAREPHDIVFVPHEKLPPFVSGPKVITVYDLVPLRQYLRNPISMTAKLHFIKAITWTIKKADAVLVISEATKKSVLEVTGIDPGRITVTPLGYDTALFRPAPAADCVRVREKYGLSKDYFINTSSLLWYRKNLPGLIRAFAGSGARGAARLVITGKSGMDYDNVMAAIRSLGLEDDVLILGYVPLEDMPALLGGAIGLAFPSLHEGFGLPIVEAFACGCPVMTSNCSSMPEVAGDAAILVDPLDEGAISGALTRLASDSALREELTKRGFERARAFSWEKTAQLTLDVFEGFA
ncbi:MAG: glycosyltransferase family 4 protein [Deltaproteobacteria bacterium]|nr:glycosyltransferase family 4 protein [Deltaproteobacteria bacterium]